MDAKKKKGSEKNKRGEKTKLNAAKEITLMAVWYITRLTQREESLWCATSIRCLQVCDVVSAYPENGQLGNIQLQSHSQAAGLSSCDSKRSLNSSVLVVVEWVAVSFAFVLSSRHENDTQQPRKQNCCIHFVWWMFCGCNLWGRH